MLQIKTFCFNYLVVPSLIVLQAFLLVQNMTTMRETEKKKTRETETDRDRLRQTETDRDRQKDKFRERGKRKREIETL